MRAVLLALALAPAVLSAGSSAHSQDSEPQRFVAGTTAILVDVVVRDRQGRPVTDLTASDFELYEDDVRQTIGSVTMVAPGRHSEGVSASGAGGDSALDGGREPAPRAVEVHDVRGARVRSVVA